MAEYDFRVLGPLEVLVDGKDLPLGGAQPRTLLASLLANRNEVVSAGRLSESIWPSQPPATAHKSIQKYVSLLRKQLGDRLVTRDGGYAITARNEEVDADRFTHQLRQAREADASGAILEAALGLWRGDPYPELADSDVAPGEIDRLNELRLEAEEMLIEDKLGVGRHADIVGDIEALISRHPYRERLWAFLMLALYRSGRQSEALDAYRRLRNMLGEELGIEPTPDLQELEERILLQDPGLDLTPSNPTNLPAPLSSFIGRAHELEQLEELLASTRLLTLSGTAGSGKTRLALELGRSLLDEIQGGVFLVELAPIRSPDQVVEAVAMTLGVGSGTGRTTLEVVADYLSERALILIVDNCEHLLMKAAETIRDLLRSASGLVVVATSRQRLGIEGEVVFDVPPLPYPTPDSEGTEAFDAVQLFLERARSVGVEIEDANSLGTVGEIVRRLDGIPLAIELAAARTRAMGLEEIGERLDDRFSLLTSPSAFPLERHSTLEAAVDWSYRLLAKDERVLLQRLSVFRGSFDLEAAASVCGTNPLERAQVLDLLARLVDKSLVVRIPSETRRGRYFLLETLREFAHAQLGANKSGPLRDAHAEYYLRFVEDAAERLTGPEQALWFHRIRLEHDNLRKALNWTATTDKQKMVRIAVAMGRYWDSVGPRSEGHDWLSRAVEMSRKASPELRVEALLQASEVFSSFRASLPRRYAEEALAISERTGNTRDIARSLCALTWSLALEEDPEKAIEHGLRALPILEDLGDRWELALCLERLGQAGYHRPDWSIEMLQRACQIYREIGDRTREALTMYKTADRLAHSLDKIETAKEYAQRAVATLEEIGSPNDRAHAKLEYGKILRRAGEPEKAAVMLEDAFGLLSRSGDDRCSARALTALGTSQLEAGLLDRAEKTLRRALEDGHDLDEQHTMRAALAGMARLMILRDRNREAVTLLAVVDRLSRTLGVPVSTNSSRKRKGILETLRAAVGESEFDHLWEHGDHMSIDQALEVILGPQQVV